MIISKIYSTKSFRAKGCKWGSAEHVLCSDTGEKIVSKLNEVIDCVNLLKLKESCKGITVEGKGAKDMGRKMDIIKKMHSENYKERFQAEYWQLKERYEKLHTMCIRYEAGTLDFTPDCSLELLTEQKKHMGMYLKCLEIRAEIEKVDLKGE